MRIAHNISSLSINRHLTSNQLNASKHMNKLGSGLRINIAADDAAGLAISEKMRNQIRGLEQASRNILDGISLLQTADGALHEVHALLQRGNELSVQAANDTNTIDDRKKIQNEIDEIIGAIDGISTTTQFNTIKVFRGGGTLPPVGQGTGTYTPAGDPTFTTKEELNKALQDYMLKTSEDLIFNHFGIQPKPNTQIDVIFKDESAGGRVAWVSSLVNTSTGEASSFDLVIDTADFLNQNLWVSKDRVIAHEMAHAIMAASGMNWKDSATPDWFKEGAAEYIAGADERVAGSLSILGSEQKVVDALSASSSSSHFYSASYVAVKYLDQKIKDETGNTKSIKDLMQILADGNLKTLDTALKELTRADGTQIFSNGTSQFTSDYKLNGANFIRNNMDLDPSDGDFDGTGSIIGTASDIDIIPDTPNSSPSNFNYNWSASTEFGSVGSNFISISENGFETDGIIKIQVGANSDETIDITLNRIDSTSMGLYGVDVVVLADEAITSFSQAIDTISSERGRLGAIQNRLEHTLTVTGINAENTQAAESRIRDTDMAQELMGLTKRNILLQAANSLLSQSNQQPEQVLQLLR